MSKLPPYTSKLENNLRANAQSIVQPEMNQTIWIYGVRIPTIVHVKIRLHFCAMGIVHQSVSLSVYHNICVDSILQMQTLRRFPIAHAGIGWNATRWIRALGAIPARMPVMTPKINDIHKKQMVCTAWKWYNIMSKGCIMSIFGWFVETANVIYLNLLSKYKSEINRFNGL